MFGLFITIPILIAVLFNPCIDPPVISTNCTIINVTVENYIHEFEIIYKYSLLIKAEDVFLEIKKVGDYKSFNSTMPCYIINNRIRFSNPFPNYKCFESIYITKILLIFIGVVIEFMFYHNLSF